jgi:hypothetical protein
MADNNQKLIFICNHVIIGGINLTIMERSWKAEGKKDVGKRRDSYAKAEERQAIPFSLKLWTQFITVNF